jgi:hypothetical protein
MDMQPRSKNDEIEILSSMFIDFNLDLQPGKSHYSKASAINIINKYEKKFCYLFLWDTAHWIK